MKNFFVRGLNLSLILKKRFNEKSYAHCFVSDTLVDINFLSGQTYVFPLFIDGELQLALDFESNGRKPNFSNNFQDVIKITYKEIPNPQDIFAYIYAVLNCNIYRKKYITSLVNDFPRIPFTSNYQLFKSVSKLGNELISLHLLNNDCLNNPVAKFFGKDSELVKSKAIYKDGKLFVNETQYFEKVEKEIWEFHVGGYQVLDKWFKDRIGKHLDDDDIRHVCKVITAISKTLDVQNEIDKLYIELENSLIKTPQKANEV